MQPITLFSWGYWGWGNATPYLLEAVDAVEEDRGFRPPRFVDIRIRRSVRAVGFREHAFEKLIGSDRYLWMPRLGNNHVKTGTGPRIQIVEPDAAAELVDIAIEEAHSRRRLLFFCACEYPMNDGVVTCHRVEVARLLRDNAGKRGLAMQTLEWPGGVPSEIELQVSPAVFRDVERGRSSVPLSKPVRLVRYAGLAWGTRLRIHSGKDKLTMLTGPARYQSGSWVLPVLGVLTGLEADGSTPAEWAASFRESHGYAPEQVAPRQRVESRPAK